MPRFVVCSLVLAFALLSPVMTQAAVLKHLDIELSFDAVKTKHWCFDLIGLDRVEGADGTCGLFTEYAEGQTYQGYLRFAGDFFLTPDGNYLFENDRGYPDRSGSFDDLPTICKAGYLCPGYATIHNAYISGKQISFLLGNRDNFVDLRTIAGSGSGIIDWIDDDDPWGMGHFDLTNVQIRGLPAVPLPASAPLMLAALGLLGWRCRA